MLTRFEIAYLACEPFLPAIYGQVRGRLRELAARSPNVPSILDIGGRKSHYTTNVRARVVISELPRVTEVQRRLHLGLQPEMPAEIQQRRSNVTTVVFDDMADTQLTPCTFQCAVAVEVLEHVENDSGFLQNVYRVLCHGGTFLMTTPNGDAVPNTNPDHKRHYRAVDLVALLERHFDRVRVEYAVAGGKCHRWSLESWSRRRPAQTARAMLGGWLNGWQSLPVLVRESAIGTQHLLAMAEKF